jgi:hypothetical protein
MVDNLNTYCSESWVRWVAERPDLDIDLGAKGKRCVLLNRHSQAALSSDPSQRIVFHHTPKHCSWLSQIWIWLSTLVRRLFARGSFTSIDHLDARVLALIGYYIRTMAKPLK